MDRNYFKEESFAYNDLMKISNFTDIIPKLPEFELAPDPTYDLIEKQKEANELLKQVVENTSVLKELVEINRKTQLNTEELTYVMKAIYNVAKAESKDEADSLFSKALGIVNSSGEAAGNVASLISLLMGIYNTVLAIL